MSEKRLSFVIDPTKAKAGADAIRQSLVQVKTVADQVQRALDKISSGAKIDNVSKGFTDVVKSVEKSNTALKDSVKQTSAAEKAQKSLAASIQFWEQRQKDLTSTQYKHLVQLRESARQVEAYQKSLVDGLSAVQRMSKAENELQKELRDTKIQLDLYERGLSQKAVQQRQDLALQKQLAQSQARLQQTYSKEYAQLIKNNEAIKKRRQELLGLDSSQKKAAISANSLHSAALALGGALGALSLKTLATELVRTADAYTGIQNRLAVVTDGTLDLTEATRQLLDISIESRTELDSTMDVYSKLIRVTKDMTLSNAQLLRITESVSKAVAMSGASAQGAEGALLQFSQALAGDFKASAQELNSIIEQTPAVAQLMADALNKADSSMNASIGNLKLLAADGRISTETLLRGIILMSDTIDEQFNNSTRTVAQGMTALKGSITVAIGELDKAIGASNWLAESLTNLSKVAVDFKSEIAAAAATIGTFVTVLGVGGLISLLNPVVLGFTAIAAAVGGLVGIFVKNRVEMALTEKKAEDLAEANKTLKRTYDDLAKSYNTSDLRQLNSAQADVVDKLKEATANLAREQEKLEMLRVRDIYNRSQVEAQIKVVNELRKEVELHNTQLNRIHKSAIDAYGGDVQALLKDTWRLMMGGKTAAEEQADKIDKLVKALGEEYSAEENLMRKQAEAILLQRAYAKAKEEGVEITTDFVKTILGQTKVLDQIMRSFKRTTTSTRDWGSELESLRKTLDPVYAAQKEMEESMQVLNNTVAKGSPLYIQLSEAIQNRYKKSLTEATQTNKEYAESFQTIRNVLDGTQPFYETYYDLVNRINNSAGTQAEKVEAIREAYRRLMNDLAEHSTSGVDIFSDAPSVSGMDLLPQEDPYEKFNKEEEALTEWYERKRALYIEDQEKMLELHQGYTDRLNAIDLARKQFQLDNTETLFGSLASITKAGFGEQSAAYKAMFYLEKSIAIARAAIAVKEAIAQAAASGPFPWNLAAMASVASATAGLVSSITAITIPDGMAHDGIDSVPQTGTWLLEKGERVTTAQTSARLDRTLDRIEAGMSDEGGYYRGGSRGGVVVDQTINVTGSVDNRTANQIASATARKQRMAEKRFGR